MIQRAVAQLVAEGVVVESMRNSDDPADCVQREAEAQVDGRGELDGHHHDEREARFEGEQPDCLDLDGPDLQLQRAAVAGAAFAKEATTSDQARVQAQSDPGRRHQVDRERVAAAGGGVGVNADADTRALDGRGNDASELDGEGAANGDGTRLVAGDLQVDLADVEWAQLRAGGQDDALGCPAGERQPIGGVDADHHISLD